VHQPADVSELVCVEAVSAVAGLLPPPSRLSLWAENRTIGCTVFTAANTTKINNKFRLYARHHGLVTDKLFLMQTSKKVLQKLHI
jgi:hypothetical protein